MNAREMFVVIGLASFSVMTLCAIGLFLVPDRHTFARNALLDFAIRCGLLTAVAVLGLLLTL